MADQPKLPLYQVMENACFAAPEDWRAERAAEIRALADWLVPEDFGDPFDDNETIHETQARMHIRMTLLAEAARAEAGG